MTTVDDRPVAPPAPVGARRLRRRTWAVVAAASLLVVPGVVVGIVRAVDAAALGQVHVFLDPRSFTCADTSDVTTVAVGDGDDAYRVPAVKAGPDLDCRLSVVLRNDSGRDVDIEQVVFPFAGAASGSGLHVDRSFTQGLAPVVGSHQVDAHFDYEHQAPLGLGAGDVLRLDYHLSWSNGCIDPGGTQRTDESPVVTVGTGLARVDVGTAWPGWAVEGTDDSLAARC